MKRILLLIITGFCFYFSTNLVFANSTTSFIGSSFISDPSVAVSIFPNPVIDNTLTINSDLDFIKIEILSIVGKTVFSKDFEKQNKITLQLENLEKGLYIVKIKFTEIKTYTEKILVK
ncbi:MAG: T9SS type A sorting domain-containing protein [Bacteroidales bacterium]|nr:T9SS type A sorting domain-containing protein [Bacteroidales bacterium]